MNKIKCQAGYGFKGVQPTNGRHVTKTAHFTSEVCLIDPVFPSKECLFVVQDEETILAGDLEFMLVPRVNDWLGIITASSHL